MKSRFSLRTNRRGYTVTEVITASALMLAVLLSITSIMSMAGRMEQTVQLNTETDQKASAAMNRMIQEVREAKAISIPATHQLRVYYPLLRANGYYDRFVTDPNSWVQFYRADQNGNASATGTFLWRSSSSGSPRALTANVKNFGAVQNSSKSVRLTLELEKVSGVHKGSTRLTERVLYLRNN